MRKRLYFLLPDVKHAKQTLRDLLLARIEERHIHTLAKEDIDIKDLPEATLSQKSDVIRGMQLGLLVGAITGAVTGFAVFSFPPEGMSFPVGVILTFILLGAVFGIWGFGRT